MNREHFMFCIISRPLINGSFTDSQMFFFRCWRAWSSGFIHVAPELLSKEQKRETLKRLQKHFTHIIMLKTQFVIRLRKKQNRSFSWLVSEFLTPPCFVCSFTSQSDWILLAIFFSECAVGDQWMCDTVASIYHTALMPSGQYEALSEMVERKDLAFKTRECVRCSSRETVLGLENSTCLDTGLLSHLY